MITTKDLFIKANTIATTYQRQIQQEKPFQKANKNKKIKYENKYETQKVCKTHPTLDIKKIVLKTFQIGIDQLGMSLKYALKKKVV